MKEAKRKREEERVKGGREGGVRKGNNNGIGRREGRWYNGAPDKFTNVW